LGDYVLVRLDPLKQQGLVVLVHGSRVRTGEVLSVGPGSLTKRGKRIRMDVSTGERIAFFREHLEHRQGKAILHALPDDLGLLREADILFSLPHAWEGTLS
jgi:co-chaperonin GroES (HSP10)